MVTLKPCADHFKSKENTYFISTWILLSGTVAIVSSWEGAKPFLYSPLLIFSVLKGFIVWNSTKISTEILKENVSSISFQHFISLGVSALILNAFFGETLSIIAQLSILFMGILGLLFFIVGPGSKLSKEGLKRLTKLIFLVMSLIIIDHIVIKNTHWALHLFIYAVSFFTISLISSHSLKNWEKIFIQKETLIAGSVIAFAEILFMFSMSLMPISLAVFFARLTIPLIMVYSSIKYKEDKWSHELFFGALAIIFALPIIFDI
jgi:hypothetical protein